MDVCMDVCMDVAWTGGWAFKRGARFRPVACASCASVLPCVRHPVGSLVSVSGGARRRWARRLVPTAGAGARALGRKTERQREACDARAKTRERVRSGANL